MKCQIVVSLLILGGLAESTGQLPVFEGSDTFAGVSRDLTKWNTPFAEGTGQLTQSGGLLKFSSPTASLPDEENVMAWPWLATGPLETSWSVQADVNVPVIPLADGHSAVGMGVFVRNGSDPVDFFSMSLENVRSPGQPQEYNFYNGVDVDDDTTEYAVPASPGKVAAVRIVWNADTLTLSAQYDPDGPTNGYQWQVVNTFNPVANGWNMTPFDVFEVGVGGYAELTAVAASKNVYADNFLITNVASANLAGSDNFNDNSRNRGKWGDDEGESGGSLTEVNGRLEFTKTGTVDGSAGGPWIANTGSFTEDWEAHVDVHVGEVVVAEDADDLRIYLEVGAGLFSAAVQLDLTNEGGFPLRRFRFEEEGPGGGGATAATTATDGAVRVAFDAANKELSFYYDENGGTDGYVWTLLGTVDVDDPSSDWELTESSRFRISINGESEGVVVASGEAYADGFNAVSAFDPMISGTPNNFDFFTTPGRSLQKWGEIIENGTAELNQSGDGVVRFAADASGPDDDSMEAWIWQSNGSFSSSWSAQVDVNVPFIALAPGHTAVGLGLAVLNSADPEDNFTAALENYRTVGQPQEFHFLSTLDTNGTSAPETFAPAASTLSSVRVAWDHKTKQLTAAYDADGPLNGYSWTVFKTFSPVGAASWNMTASNSFRIALYASAEETEVTLNHGFWADNFYIFGGTTMLLPVVKNGTLTDLSHEGVRVHGSVNEKGSQRAVYIDWGTTNKYGSTLAADPAVTDGTSNTIIVGELTGLMPHTKYHCRIRATNALGTATGPNITFTTANRDPIGEPDAYTVLPGAVVVLNVLQDGEDDSDPDGDPLSLKSNTALMPASAGKLTKSGNNLIFTASANFSGAAFTYVAKDAFGGASEPVTVNLTPGTCELSHAETFPLASAAQSYLVTVEAEGAWSVQESLPWVSVTPISGNGNATVMVTLQGHIALKPRSGKIFIGGVEHLIEQAGVIQPDLLLPDSPLAAVVGGMYFLDIVTINPPVTYTVTGLPPGLSLDKNTGDIGGRPTTHGSFDVKVKAKNAAGASPTELEFTIEVARLNPNFTGVFHGLAAPHPGINGGFGSRLELTITGKGGVTGKLITANATKQLAGNLEPDAYNENAASLILSLSGPGPSQMFLNLSFDGSDGTAAGTIGDFLMTTTTPVEAWRNTWSTLNKPSAFAGLHAFSLEPPAGDPFVPEGFGFGSMIPNAKTGVVMLTGKLPDHTTFTSSTFVGPMGQVLVYGSLYANSGCAVGKLQLLFNDEGNVADNEVGGELLWFKHPQPLNSKDTVYPFGIPPVPLVAVGSAYTGVSPGGLILDLTPPQGALLSFSGGELAEESLEFMVDAFITNPSATGTTNKASFSLVEEENPNKVTMANLNAATGAFSGEFILPGMTPAENRKVQYFGQIVRDPFEGLVGRGYCLVSIPIFPPFITSSNALKFSSRVIMSPGL